MQHYCCKQNFKTGKIEFLSEIPQYQSGD